LKLVQSATEREILERSRRFGEQDQVERVVRPVGNGHFDWHHAELLNRFKGGAVNLGRGVLLHPTWEIPLPPCARIEVQPAGYARHVASVGAGNGLQYEHGVFDTARHGAELVERPAQRHRAGARHPAIGGPQPGAMTLTKPTNPAAVPEPGPALDPDEPSSSSHGFIVWPPNQMSFSASAPMLSLATSTAPASCRRFTTAASWVGTRSLNGSAPYVVGMPAVSTRSLAPQGMPCSGPRYLPDLISLSACLACVSANSRVSVITQRSFGSKRASRSR